MMIWACRSLRGNDGIRLVERCFRDLVVLGGRTGNSDLERLCSLLSETAMTVDSLRDMARAPLSWAGLYLDG